MSVTVWSVCNGDKYQDDDVYILRDMVSRNLHSPHLFRCMSDREIPGVDCLIPDEDWPGWWAKLLLFKYSSGLCLYLDLDTVVTGSLDELFSVPLSMPRNWGQSGHGGCQSSVMSWAKNYPQLYETFNVDELEAPARGNCGAYRGLWGDQEYITELFGEPGTGTVAEMTGIYSYKYHCRQALPDDARVVCFHGEPKPGQVSEQWVLQSRYMQTQQSHTR